MRFVVFNGTHAAKSVELEATVGDYTQKTDRNADHEKWIFVLMRVAIKKYRQSSPRSYVGLHNAHVSVVRMVQ